MDENELVEYEVIPQDEISLRTMALGVNPIVLIEVVGESIQITVAGVATEHVGEMLSTFGMLLTNTNVEVSDEED